MSLTHDDLWNAAQVHPLRLQYFACIYIQYVCLHLASIIPWYNIMRYTHGGLEVHITLYCNCSVSTTSDNFLRVLKFEMFAS